MQPIVCRRNIVPRVVRHRRPLRSNRPLRPLSTRSSRQTCRPSQTLRPLRPRWPLRSLRPGRKQTPLRRTHIRSISMVARHQRNIRRPIEQNTIRHSIVRRRRVRPLKRYPNWPRRSLRPHRPRQTLSSRGPGQPLRPRLPWDPLQTLRPLLPRWPHRPQRPLHPWQSLRPLRARSPRRPLRRQHPPRRSRARRIPVIAIQQGSVAGSLPQHHILQGLVRRRSVVPLIHQPRQPRRPCSSRGSGRPRNTREPRWPG